MFRKFKEGLSQASASITGRFADERKVNSLVAMGFEIEQARNAIRACNGDVDEAAELLLAGGTASTTEDNYTSYEDQQQRQNQQQQQQQQGQNDNYNEAELQRAMQESLQEEELRLIREAQLASKQGEGVPVRSAASVRAGQAALQRLERTSAPTRKKTPRKTKSKSPPRGTKTKPKVKTPPSSGNNNTTANIILDSNDIANTNDLTTPISSHPNVKVPKKLQDKSKEEQILRCADRLKSSPRAVDTLYISLTKIQSNPNNDMYRKIDKLNPGYQRSLANAPGAEDMLKAMNFKPSTNNKNTLVLQIFDVDSALLYLGISALEQTRKTTEYKDAKRNLKFINEIQQIQKSSNDSELEAIKRAEFMAKCPSEPDDGRGALMQIVVGDDITLRRRFDGDDTLGDVLNWLGGHGSIIPGKILKEKEWSLIDINRYPTKPIDCNVDQDKTLQYIGCWPSGRLEIVPTKEEWITTTA